MKTILTRLSDEQAQKELPKFAMVAIVCSLVSIVVLWPLAIAGALLGSRALLLTWHKGNKNNKHLIALRLASATAFVVGVLVFVLVQVSE